MIGDAHAPGATPLDRDEAAGLIPRHISTQRDLNEWEQANILDATRWASAAPSQVLLEQSYVRELHRRMFDRTWEWAGRYRTSDKSLGVEWSQITERMESLLRDAHFWLDHETWSPVECAVRLHHRMVWIHPFPNGNGRHARLMADLTLVRQGRPALTWGRGDLVDANSLRDAYIAALRDADRGNIAPLVRFAQS